MPLVALADKMTPNGLLVMAAAACRRAETHESRGRLQAARECYLDAEECIGRADAMRGVDKEAGPVVLDARVDLERRMGIAA